MNVNSIKSEFQFIGSSINRLAISNDFVVFPDASTLDKNIDVSYDILEISKDEDNVWGTIDLYIECTISDCNSNQNETNNVCTISLSINGCFIDNTSLDESTFKKMLSVNGCAALYSIARSFVMSVSSQLSVNCNITLPMINTFKLVDKSEVNNVPCEP